MKVLLISIGIIIFLYSDIYSQKLKVSGKVNFPCEILSENTGERYQTDDNWNYSIENLNKGEILKFETPGFHPRWIKVDSSMFNRNIILKELPLYLDGCPTTMVLIKNYYLNNVHPEIKPDTIKMFDWDFFLKQHFVDYVFVHHTNLKLVQKQLDDLKKQYKSDSVYIIERFNQNEGNKDITMYETEYSKKYSLDSLKSELYLKQFKPCAENENYNKNGYKSFFSVDASHFTTKIDYLNFADKFNYSNIQSFKTSCGAGCSNILFVKDKDSVISILNDKKNFNKYLLPIDNIYKALFCINYSDLFLNTYGYACIPFYNVRYKKTNDSFYVEHVLFLNDSQYYHVLLQIDKKGNIKVLEKDKDFKFGPCY